MSVSSSDTADALARAMGRYADGDYKAFEIVYEGLMPIVRGCLRRWVGDSALAEDLAQETFIRVHRARERYRRGAPVAAWVLTIARRLSIDALRRKSRKKEVLAKDGSMPEGVQLPTVALDETEELIVALKDAINELPESLRAVVAMHKLEEKPLAEVARILGINEGAARVRAHRGYKRLRERMLTVFSGRKDGE